ITLGAVFGPGRPDGEADAGSSRVAGDRPGSSIGSRAPAVEPFPDVLRDRGASRELIRLVSERAAAEAVAERDLAAGLAATEKDHQKRRQASIHRHGTIREKLVESAGRLRRSKQAERQAALSRARNEFAKLERRIIEASEERRKSAEEEF